MAVPLIAEGLPLHAEALLLQLKVMLLALKALLLLVRDEMGKNCLISIKSLPFLRSIGAQASKARSREI